MIRLALIGLFSLGLALTTQVGFAEDTAVTPAASTAYPIDYCIVSGEKLGSMGEPVSYMNKGREVKFCCKGCVDTFKRDRKSYLSALDEAIVKAQLDSYPTENCVVGGGKLGGMGEPVNYIYQNRLVRFCCANCIETFESDPVSFLKILDESPAKAK